MVSFTKGEIRYMAQYITKKQQVQNLLKEIENQNKFVESLKIEV